MYNIYVLIAAMYLIKKLNSSRHKGSRYKKWVYDQTERGSKNKKKRSFYPHSIICEVSQKKIKRKIKNFQN